MAKQTKAERHHEEVELSEAFYPIGSGDVDPLEPRMRRIVENAYRRGFVQGATAGVEASEQHHVSVVNVWMSRLWTWRRKDHGGKQDGPEWLTTGRKVQSVPRNRKGS